MRECKCANHVGERVLEDSEFNKNKRKPGGVDTICKRCNAIKTKKWRDENKDARGLLKEKQNEYHKRYYHDNKEKVLSETKRRRRARSERLASDHQYRLSVFKKRWLSYIKTRAKNRDIECTITIDDLIVPDLCPVLNIPIRICSRPYGGNGPTDDDAPTVDRIDPSKGYTSDNIVIVSWRANRLKNNATLVELQKMLTYYSQFFV